MSAGFLERMAESSRARVRHAKQSLSEAELARRVEAMPPPPKLAFSRAGFDLIAEIKPASPSEGALAGAAFEPQGLAADYVDGGALALSVLTEPSRFGGSLELLRSVADAAPQTPVMRKDFLVEPYQVWEARQHGAAGVLLIVGMTDDGDTEAMLATALRCGMFALLEAFDDDQRQRAQRMAERAKADRTQALLGLNCRDLQTLEVDKQRFHRFQPANAGAHAMFAESGVQGPQDAAELAAAGWDGVLVGSALMRSAAPGHLVAEMLAEGRKSKAQRQ